MSCTCFDDTIKEITDLVKDKIGEHTELEVNWKNRVFFFGENPPSIPVVIPIEYSYRSIRTNGEPYKNKTTGTTSLTMSFCPICGKPTREKNNG